MRSDQLSGGACGVKETEFSRCHIAGWLLPLCARPVTTQPGGRPAVVDTEWRPAEGQAGAARPGGWPRQPQPSASAASLDLALVFSLRALWSLIYILCTFFSKITKDVTQR